MEGTIRSSELTVDGTINSSDLADPVLALEETIYADGSGNIRRGTPAPPSDERLKKNIYTIDNALEKVLKLRGVSYEWKDADRFGSQSEIGFIAQEIQEVIPDVVRPNGEYLGVKIQNVVAVVVEAVKELHTKVEEYFTRTERLEREVELLRREIEVMKNGGTDMSVEQESPCTTCDVIPEEIVETVVETEVEPEVMLEPEAETEPVPVTEVIEEIQL